MTLQSSGAISISQMRDEYGLSNPISMSNFYGKNGLPTSGAISFSNFYGKSNYLDTQTVTVGSGTLSSITYYGRQTSPLNFGTISDGTSNVYGGTAITGLHWNGTQNYLFLQFSATVANSGWTTMYIGSNAFTRASAFYSTNLFRWTTGNPFPAVGSQVAVNWAA